MSDQELIEWYKRVFNEYPSVGLLAFIREVMEQTAPVSAWEAVPDGEYALNERGNRILIRTSASGRTIVQTSKTVGNSLRRTDVTLPPGWVLMRQRPTTAAGEE